MGLAKKSRVRHSGESTAQLWLRIAHKAVTAEIFGQKRFFGDLHMAPEVLGAPQPLLLIRRYEV